MNRCRVLTKFPTGDPILDRMQDHQREVLQPVLSNPILNLTDYRFMQAPYPSDKDPVCLVVQHRTPPDTWATVFVLGPTGKILLGGM